MSAIDTLISVIVGAVIGFLSSIGFDRWKESREKKELKDKIEEELEIILQEATTGLETEEFIGEAFVKETFDALKQDLIRKLDVKIFRAVLETYNKIEVLRSPISISRFNKQKYGEAIETIKKTIDLLK